MVKSGSRFPGPLGLAYPLACWRLSLDLSALCFGTGSVFASLARSPRNAQTSSPLDPLRITSLPFFMPIVVTLRRGRTLPAGLEVRSLFKCTPVT
jgi:hypothetical protein